MGQGSGFFISADGYAVTNNHVVDKADSVEITTDDGKTYTAKVIGTDPKTDIALIKVDGRTDFPFVKLADKTPRIGDWVLAVGNPFGLGGTVTAGIVSARGRDIGAGPYDDFIQIDAPVNKGNSGGPTFDVDGNVIGVNTAIFSPSGGYVGIAFAIPAETVKSVVAQLQEKGSVTRGWIGVQIQPVTADIADSIGLKKAEGALVADPQADSPAAKAGIQSGDVIVSLNGAGEGRARSRQEDRRHGAERQRQARHLPQGRRDDRHARPRRAAARAAPGAHQYPRAGDAQARKSRGSVSRSLPRTRPPAPAMTASSSPSRPQRAGRQPGLPHRRRDPRCGRQDRLDPRRRAQGLGRCASRRQAYRTAARQVGRGDAVRRRAGRTRLRAASAMQGSHRADRKFL